jgi:hypothetical protein
MSDEELKAELERLRNENAALKKGASSNIRMKVSEKGSSVDLRDGTLSRDLVQGAVAEAAGYVSRHSGIHCGKRSAIEGEGLNPAFGSIATVSATTTDQASPPIVLGLARADERVGRCTHFLSCLLTRQDDVHRHAARDRCSAGTVLGCNRDDPDSDFVASARRESIGTIGGIGPDPMVPMPPMPCSCGPASRSLHPIFQRAPVGSKRSHRRACP